MSSVEPELEPGNFMTSLPLLFYLSLPLSYFKTSQKVKVASPSKISWKPLFCQGHGLSLKLVYSQGLQCTAIQKGSVPAYTQQLKFMSISSTYSPVHMTHGEKMHFYFLNSWNQEYKFQGCFNSQTAIFLPCCLQNLPVMQQKPFFQVLYLYLKKKSFTEI